MPRRLMLSALALLCAAPLSASAGIATGLFSDPDPDKPEWAEVELKLPAAPQDKNLLVFLKNGNQRFAVDSQSLSVEKDGTIRYTLVATSSSGVKNISYEALRCETAEKKLFAFGQPNGEWTRSRSDNWRGIFPTGAKNQHYVLYNEFFCEGSVISGRADALLIKLRAQRIPD